MKLNKKQLDHLEYLRNDIYKCKAKWPQFNILLKTIEEELIPEMNENSKILIQERAYFFGGYSLFSPLFSGCQCVTMDTINSTSTERFGAQTSWTTGDAFIKEFADFSSVPEKIIQLESETFDYIFIPNIIHHVKDQRGMMLEWKRLLKPGGKILVFEGLVRELHHVPDDFLRYTVYGLQNAMEEIGLKFIGYENGSGVFDVISYVWQQALDFLPPEVRKEKEKWFYETHYKELQTLDTMYKENLVKKEKQFPMSYVVWATK